MGSSDSGVAGLCPSHPAGGQELVAAVPCGQWGQEAAGGRQEPGVINGTMERVTPLWFQLTPELCSDEISW